tara:strand:- start:854 stop:1099 length:246 start_codon:yes stop_codon:yes gene_type:complete
MTGKFIRLSQSFEFTLPVIQEFLTLDNIFKYASEDELRAIVSSIIGRLREQKEGCSENILNSMILLDADLDKLVKGLRDVK